MPKQILFIKAIKQPQANPVAPLVDKLKGLVEELASATGADSGDGMNGDDDQASQQALAEGDTTTDPAAGAGTDDEGGGTGQPPKPGAGDGADGGAGGGDATPGDGKTPGGAEGEGDGDATDPAAGGAQYGPHNVEPGHHIAFAAGEFKGAGKVTASGEDGCTAKDKTGREHRVHWHEVTGHNDAAAGAGAAPAQKDGEGKPPKDPQK